MTQMTPRETTRVKVTLTRITKDALTAIADDLGVSLSALLVASAVERWLGPGERYLGIREISSQLSRLSSQLEDIYKVASELPTERPTAPEKKPRKPRWGPRMGVTGCAKEETPGAKVRTTPKEAIEGTKPLHIDHLVNRFGGDRSLKARLCQLGGRKGDLFQGSLPHALKVAQVTSQLDPDGLSWFPTTPDRDFWVIQDAQSYARSRLGSTL